ncbi:MAG: acyl-CoA thioesterase/BAAT N-terminal domain-containing protein [Chloroflexi bacterium]|nr:acyl-CoA thioesterase/BAAT N-terminal domain-containing protein [Chloroflexota bacterium]
MALEARIHTTPKLEVAPPNALIDERVSIRVLGLEPDQTVVLRARMRDDVERDWSSSVTFRADATGAVDVSVQPALSGTYQGIDQMGLLWSMAGQFDDGKGLPSFMKTPLTTTVTAEVGGEVVASATLERTHLAPGVRVFLVREQGLVGTLFRPDSDGPRPAIIVLGGSEGGLSELPAALLASHGYAALALGYFGIEGLPRDHVGIPLEYLETAMGWLQAQEGVASDRLAVMGGSRGGELALLLGATFPQIKAVVGVSPIGVMIPGFRRGFVGLVGMVMRRPPGWTYRGAPLPCWVPFKLSFSSIVSYVWKTLARAPIALTPFWLEAMKDKDALERAAIPAERINGPVLLLSGQDDQFCPSGPLSEVAMERLAGQKHPYPYEHVSYPGAGHVFGLPPYLPATLTKARHPQTGAVYLTGGNPKDNAFAAVDSWARILRFLEESFGRPG